MKLLQNKPGVTPPGGDYSRGTMRDNPGDGTGSRMDTEFHGDYVQLHEAVFAASGLAANGLPDNDSDGQQLYEAYRKVFKPYKEYAVKVSQSGTSAPVVITMNNDIGAIVWTRQSAGQYRLTATGRFTLDKVTVHNSESNTGSVISPIHGSVDFIRIDTGTGTPGSSLSYQDAVLSNTMFTVRVYD